MRFCIVFFLLSFAAAGQTRPADRLTDQDIAAIFSGISQHTGKLEPMLRQLQPADWVAKGAPDTYVTQWNATLQQLAGIRADMAALALEPDHLTVGMKALFRVQAAHQVLASVLGGLRKYQNPALADLIEAVAAEDGADIERLQQYLLNVALDKEQQFDVMDKEAQRCRANLSRQPAETRPARLR